MTLSTVPSILVTGPSHTRIKYEIKGLTYQFEIEKVKLDQTQIPFGQTNQNGLIGGRREGATPLYISLV